MAIFNIKLSKARKKGFTLVELAISITIIGLIASSALSVAISNDDYTRTTETKLKLDRIEEAIAGYAVLNKRIPCPADGTLAITNTNFGIEGTPSVSGGQGKCASNNFNDTANIHMGTVPVTTLQLPDDYMFDGWGRRISYVVDARFANNAATNVSCDGTISTVCFQHTSNGSLTVRNSAGGTRSTTAMYVLFSHGINGHGAFPKNGGATRVGGFPSGNPYRDNSAAEFENAEFDKDNANTAFDAIYVQKPFTRNDDTTSATREYFDDIVRYKNTNELITETGYIWFDSTCVNAATVVNNPESNNCTNADDEDTCEQLALEIYSRCLR